MTSHESIDAQFDRAVQIVQGLPKTGPIQTDYEEKLAMYSLYKQATVGNVNSPRPGLFDMLGRAKWDAWAKHKDLNSFEAKWLYVDTLLKVLRKYSDKTTAMDLVHELESYDGDAFMSRTTSKSPNSDSSGSTVSEGFSHIQPQGSTLQPQNFLRPSIEGTESEEESGDETGEAIEPPGLGVFQDNRPQSSTSSHRYRTPMTGSLAISPPLRGIPTTQPLPGFETPSVFGDAPAAAPYSNVSPYVAQFSDPSRMTTPNHSYPTPSAYRTQMHSRPSQYGPPRPASRLSLEHAIENVQGHLAALRERLETLEARSIPPTRSHISSPRGINSPSWMLGHRSPSDGQNDPQWDIDDMGMWSLVLNPLSRGVDILHNFATFFARNENRSPTMIIVRRLCLDISFLMCVVGIISAIWRKSGVRRREVRAALLVLWRAVLGNKMPRELIERGV